MPDVVGTVELVGLTARNFKCRLITGVLLRAELKKSFMLTFLKDKI